MNPRIAFQTIWDRCQHTAEVYDALKYLQALAEMPSEKQWICCEDHVPERDDDYLITYLMRGIPVVGKSWFNTKCGFIYDNVVAWQELPEPYKEDEKEEAKE